MNNIKKHMKILGLEVQDKVTGFKGVATSVSFDLYGCVQCVVTPPVNDNGGTGDCKWFDIGRLYVANDTPVMALPDFELGHIAEGRKGPAEKPAR